MAEIMFSEKKVLSCNIQNNIHYTFFPFLTKKTPEATHICRFGRTGSSGYSTNEVQDKCSDWRIPKTTVELWDFVWNLGLQFSLKNWPSSQKYFWNQSFGLDSSYRVVQWGILCFNFHISSIFYMKMIKKMIMAGITKMILAGITTRGVSWPRLTGNVWSTR